MKGEGGKIDVVRTPAVRAIVGEKPDDALDREHHKEQQFRKTPLTPLECVPFLLRLVYFHGRHGRCRRRRFGGGSSSAGSRRAVDALALPRFSFFHSARW